MFVNHFTCGLLVTCRVIACVASVLCTGVSIDKEGNAAAGTPLE